MRLVKYSLLLLLSGLLVHALLLSGVAQTRPKPAARTKYVSVTEYDPKRDAAKDIQAAVKQAQRTKKRILLEVGGEWCVWCHTLDRFFEAHPDLQHLRAANFVTVKINFSEENENKELLAQYPPIPGYPHIYVLDSEGKLLHSQDTSALESGKSYDLERLKEFLRNWRLEK